jgi:uncharacterized protein (DUF1810 family)
LADPHNLQRFVDAQAGVYDRALAEIRAGHKTSHWMWFVFPQLKGLGSSPTAEHYGIVSLEEGRAYLAHPLLGPRLGEIAAAAVALEGRTARAVFGTPDDLKLRSSLTLFDAAVPNEAVFSQALDALCDGMRDARTLEMLSGRPTRA